MQWLGRRWRRTSRTRSQEKGKIYLAKHSPCGVKRYLLHTAKKKNSATARITGFYGDLLQKRRGFRGLLRNFFFVDLSNRSGDTNATRLSWKHVSNAIAKIGHVSVKLREAAWHDSLKLREAALPLRLYISPSLPISIYLSMFTSSAITARRAFPFLSFSLDISRSLSLSRYLSL